VKSAVPQGDPPPLVSIEMRHEWNTTGYVQGVRFVLGGPLPLQAQRANRSEVAERSDRMLAALGLAIRPTT
jgi:hypothetical protein